MSLQNLEGGSHLHIKQCYYSNPPSADLCAAGVLKENKEEGEIENWLLKLWESDCPKSVHFEWKGECYTTFINHFLTNFTLDEQAKQDWSIVLSDSDKQIWCKNEATKILAIILLKLLLSHAVICIIGKI